ncbi:hypothetical protein I0P70_17225 [Pontibacter sp. FD36]|uniref:hypothetical protein n=1 Tax=Pontibacter sp. FD36 TaxID=2789860 RepID=UPI0018AC6944|nr:hypothetical protein [Pontibacter sp. FD36]MBF8964992.1 hypothetical protein [Pontibacter sp. FD36]
MKQHTLLYLKSRNYTYARARGPTIAVTSEDARAILRQHHTLKTSDKINKKAPDHTEALH